MLYYNKIQIQEKATFIIVLAVFIAAFVTISFISMARSPFEYEYQTEKAENPGNEGWVLFGFNGNNNTKEFYIDYAHVMEVLKQRVEEGKVPDEVMTQTNSETV